MTRLNTTQLYKRLGCVNKYLWAKRWTIAALLFQPLLMFFTNRLNFNYIWFSLFIYFWHDYSLIVWLVLIYAAVWPSGMINTPQSFISWVSSFTSGKSFPIYIKHQYFGDIVRLNTLYGSFSPRCFSGGTYKSSMMSSN